MGHADVTGADRRLPDLESLDPEQCLHLWDIVLTTERRTRTPFAAFSCSWRTRRRSRSSAVEAAPDKKLGEILIERGVAPAETIQAALAEQQHLRRHADAAATIRVPAEKLDQLVNIVGELVTVQARLSALAGGAGDPELMFVAEEVERLTGKLREHSMSVRMLPIGETFNKFKRIVPRPFGEPGQAGGTGDGGRRHRDRQDGDRPVERSVGPPDPQRHRPWNRSSGAARGRR